MIVALDFEAMDPALRLARRLRGLVRTVKVGSVLYTACGPEAVARLRRLGFEVMLDLKFFDIPNTVELSCRAATRLRPSRLTVHAAGGGRMLEAAVRGVHEEGKRMKLSAQQRPKVLAVTVLTSEALPSAMSAVGEEAKGGRNAGDRKETKEQVLKLTGAALKARCDGVVASVEEASACRQAFPEARFEVLCPGIRPSWAAVHDDQRRIATPAQALRAGADALVIGRPVSAAPDPREALRRILEEMADAGAEERLKEKGPVGRLARRRAT